MMSFQFVSLVTREKRKTGVDSHGARFFVFHQLNSLKKARRQPILIKVWRIG